MLKHDKVWYKSVPDEKNLYYIVYNGDRLTKSKMQWSKVFSNSTYVDEILKKEFNAKESHLNKLYGAYLFNTQQDALAAIKFLIFLIEGKITL